MPTTVLFLAQTRESPTIAEQRLACEAPGDMILDAGVVGFASLPKMLARRDSILQSGDTFKIYDTSCLSLNTMTLVRIIMKMLRRGITVHFWKPGLVILPLYRANELTRLVEILDHHWRHIHGLKTHAPDSKPGRKKRLSDDQLGAIQAQLAQEGATVASVAQTLNVGRTTLFDFLKRHAATR